MHLFAVVKLFFILKRVIFAFRGFRSSGGFFIYDMRFNVKNGRSVNHIKIFYKNNIFIYSNDF